MCIGNSGSGSGGGQVVYISISVGVLLIACVATVAVIIFLACHPSRRNRKNRVSQLDTCVSNIKTSLWHVRTEILID